MLDCLAEGMANKQIARALGISVRTVTVHVSNLLRKTGAASRTEVALRAVRATTGSLSNAARPSPGKPRLPTRAPVRVIVIARSRGGVPGPGGLGPQSWA
ncbi:MAG: hypothetical protein QOE51_3316 [Actinoplanes sp.]|nr:hypothetical protein [Actinoplanes sp.]